MKKYYVEDLSTNESKELSYNEFTQSVLYNASVSLEYDYTGEFDTQNFTNKLISFLNSTLYRKSDSIEINDFKFSFEEV